MDLKNYNITLDLKKGISGKHYINFVTNDSETNRVTFTLVDDGRVCDLSNSIVRLVASNSKVYQQDCQIVSMKDAIVTIVLERDLYSIVGNWMCELQIFDESTQMKRLTSPPFTYSVRKSLLDEDLLPGDPSFSILQNMIATIQTSYDTSQKALEDSQTALTVINEVVPNVIDATSKANEALDRATNIATSQELQNHISIVSVVPQSTKMGQLYFIRKGV